MTFTSTRYQVKRISCLFSFPFLEFFMLYFAFSPDPTKMPHVNLFPKSPTELYTNWTLPESKSKRHIVEQRIQWKEKKSHFHINKILPGNITSYTIVGMYYCSSCLQIKEKSLSSCYILLNF